MLESLGGGRISQSHPNTDVERMSNALSMVLTVSKKDLLRKEARLKRASDKKRAAKKPG